MGPDEELLGVVVHSGLVLARSTGAVVALRRITAFPAGLSLDVVVLARDVHAEAADRRARAATVQRQAEAAARWEDETRAQRESETAAEWNSRAAAERAHARRQAMIDRRYLPEFGEGDTLRLAVLTRAGGARWLDAYQSTRSAPRITTGWRPPTGWRRFRGTAWSRWSVPGRRSGFQRR
jgi:hypothetical protein